jgi:hypothetical protein
MTATHPAKAPGPALVHIEIDYSSIDVAKVRNNRTLFYLLAAASFIESGSDTYAGNLAKYYADVPEAARWLAEHWECEELQHGQALRRYVAHVWPEFDWERGYRRFFDEYSVTCSIDNFEPSQAWKWPPAAWWKPAPPPTTARWNRPATNRCCAI